MYKVIKVKNCANISHHRAPYIFMCDVLDLNRAFERSAYYNDAYRNAGLGRCDDCVVEVQYMEK